MLVAHNSIRCSGKFYRPNEAVWASKTVYSPGLYEIEKSGDVGIETKMWHGFIQQTRLEVFMYSGESKIMHSGQSYT